MLKHERVVQWYRLWCEVPDAVNQIFVKTTATILSSQMKKQIG